MVLLGTFLVLCLFIWGFALSRHPTTPRGRIWAALLALLVVTLLAWALTLVGLGASVFALVTGDAVPGGAGTGFVVALAANVAMLGVCFVVFLCLAKWTWELNKRLDVVHPYRSDVPPGA